MSQNKVLCIGMFDGVHTGHKSLIEKMKSISSENHGLNVVLSFQNHPLDVLAPAYSPDLLTTLEQRLEKFRNFGVDFAIMLPFNKKLAALSASEFIKDILIDRCDVADLVCGYNFRFGNDGEGTPEYMTDCFGKQGRKCYIMPPYRVDGVIVSSSLIRELIADGKVDEVSNFLGHYYQLDGVVVSGAGRGTQLGYPTANVEPQNKILIPPRGVYAVRVEYQGRDWEGMLNIGNRPTFEDKGERVIEVHLIDFEGDLRGSNLRITFINRLRPELKFQSFKALQAQLKKDYENVRFLLKDES